MNNNSFIATVKRLSHLNLITWNISIQESLSTQNCVLVFLPVKKQAKLLHIHRKVCPATGNDRVRSRYLYLKNLAFCQFDFTRILGAFGPIMFALRKWVGFGDSWRGEPLFLNSSFMFGRTHSSCSEGHFLSIVFGNTLPYVRKATFQNMINTKLCNQVPSLSLSR